MIGTDFSIALPADLKPGDYRLLIGRYDSQTNQRFMTPDGADFTQIAVISVR